MSSLLSVAEAQRRLLDSLPTTPIEPVSLDDAVGCVLAADVHAHVDLPPFANSSMDGFAVRSADVAGATPDQPMRLVVIGDIPAGVSADMVIAAGQSARIMTGAQLPEGSDAVVPVEDTDFNERMSGTAAPTEVLIYQPAGPMVNVRPRGQDVHHNEQVMTAGIVLRPQDIGFLAMLGEARVQVHRRPKVAVFSSGDELVPVNQPLSPGKIHDSNTHTLTALVKKYGGEPVNLGIVPDQASAVQSRLDQAVQTGVDLILSSAGVSVGAFDFVRQVVEENGRLEFWRVNMRPGKPFTFGNYRSIPFIGLPGNPVSAFVGFEVFVRPALQKMAGMREMVRSLHRVELLEPVESDGRESYLRAIVAFQDGWKARLTGHQGSGNLRSLVQGNALLLIPSGVKSLPAGVEVDAWLLT